MAQRTAAISALLGGDNESAWEWPSPFTLSHDRSIRVCGFTPYLSKMSEGAAAHAYLRIAGFGYPFFALGLCLCFGAQGAGRIGGPLAAQALDSVCAHCRRHDRARPRNRDSRAPYTLG